MATSSFFETLESRKAQFWQKCRACAAHHNARYGDHWEWPQDGVEDFFSHWSATNKQGQMRWETIPFWLILRCPTGECPRQAAHEVPGAGAGRGAGRRGTKCLRPLLRREEFRREVKIFMKYCIFIAYFSNIICRIQKFVVPLQRQTRGKGQWTMDDGLTI